MTHILPLPILKDNYVWLGHAQGRAFVVDPGEAAPVLSALRERSLRLDVILVTHHHGDHIGGVGELVAASGCPVYGPATIAQVTHPVGEGDRVALPGLGEFDVIAVPGHTLDHLAYVGQGLVFCGDTLFACGCGRLFEGSPAQMQTSLARLAELPSDTLVYCTHEYTLANQRFALAVEPGNTALRQRAEADRARREQGLPTVPFRLAQELDCNPFLRWDSPEIGAAVRQRGVVDMSPVGVFAAVRQWKDGFA